MFPEVKSNRITFSRSTTVAEHHRAVILDFLWDCFIVAGNETASNREEAAGKIVFVDPSRDL